jgi:hypothetical protein
VPDRSPTATSARHRRSDGVLLSGLISGVSCVAFILVRLEVVGHGAIARFIMLERPFADVHAIPRGVPVLPDEGYDGQFYYRLALDPADLHRSAFGIHLDTVFRLQRIGYPALAWALSLGHHRWVPTTLVLVNVAAVTVIGGLGGLAARDAGRHALWGLLIPAYFGFVFSVARDLGEPTAAAFLLAGLLAHRRDRPVLAGILLSCAALTRETAMVAVGVILVFRLGAVVARRARPGVAELTWILPVVAFAAWQVVVHSVVGQYPILVDTSDNAARPLLPVLGAIGYHLHHFNADNGIWVVELVALAAVVVYALAQIRSPTVTWTERVMLVAYVLELLVLSPAIWNGAADLRSLDEVYLLAGVVLLGSTRIDLRYVACVVLPVTAVVAAHRIVSL